MPNPCSGGAITCPVCPISIDWCDGNGPTFGTQVGSVQEFVFPGVNDILQADGDPWPRVPSTCNVIVPGWEIVQHDGTGPANPTDEGVPALAIDDSNDTIDFWWDPAGPAWVPIAPPAVAVPVQQFELGQEGPVTADPGGLAAQHFNVFRDPITITAVTILFPVVPNAQIDVDLAVNGAVVQTVNVAAATRQTNVAGPIIGTVVPAGQEIAEIITSVNGATAGEDMIVLVEYTR